MDHFLNSCCRICLAIENVMINTLDRIDNFDLSISELLFDCVNIKILESDSDPKLICEECAGELVLVAKFHEKCKLATQALRRLKEGNGLKDHEDVSLSVEIMGTESPKSETNTDDHSDDTGDHKFSTDVNPIKCEEVEYITEAFSDENYEYVIIDDNVVGMTELNPKEADIDDTLVEEIDESFIVTEFFNTETEEVDNTNNDGDRDVSAEVDDGEVEDVDGVIKSQLFRAKKRRIAFGSPKTASKININHSCKICGAGFAQLVNLNRHIQTHSDIGLGEIFTCGNCRAHFTSGDQLSAHIKEENCVNDPNSHDVMEMASGQTEQKFKINKKPKKKDHICDYCEKGFTSYSLLMTHTRVHTGEKPFTCEICSKKFATQGGLDLHVRRHSGFKPYRCVECNRGFAESSNLKVHMRIHTGEKPHKCTRCPRSFSRVFLLQIHQRTHTGERPYACDTCHKSFAQQGDLASHRRIHSGERPHKCEICFKGFIKSSGLTQHMRRHIKCGEVIAGASRRDAKDPIETVDTIDGNVYVVFQDSDGSIKQKGASE